MVRPESDANAADLPFVEMSGIFEKTSRTTQVQTLANESAAQFSGGLCAPSANKYIYSKPQKRWKLGPASSSSRAGAEVSTTLGWPSETD